ncbi:hypothetical protein [Romboutsia lituseburensis]|uniref:Uncharacterized protein n=1 Tax=Romboutsia lituseburensis DSM 797 TaxID=1121325 RepID=A0A1G9KIP4_9FIRM|nr:hypothetical protein [Romboutsia lituseburensis]CEH34919.1 Hypothetical protein RLITU_2338 [Romboutsia lituseburensis]SDL49414.1 hypothetical protein SAMN04515677_102156 [Romboutsia lituseburensis DSM 797]
MSNKVIIDGKEYTEKSVDFMNVNGEKIESNIITADTANRENILNVTIKIKEDNNEEVQNQKNDTLNIESVENIDSLKGEEKISWLKKIWTSIRNIFTK